MCGGFVLAKNKAQAGQRRKTRAPEVSLQGLEEHKEAISDPDLWALSNRLEELERLRKEGVLNTPFVALEALGALSGGLVGGRSEGQLKTVWPDDWGSETIEVPLALLLSLRDAWAIYKSAPTGKTLGEAFGVEGDGIMKSKLHTIDKHRRLAREVELEYYKIECVKSDVRRDDAIQNVADKNGLSFDTVKEAHKAHRIKIRSVLSDVGVLKGVKTSDS